MKIDSDAIAERFLELCALCATSGHEGIVADWLTRWATGHYLNAEVDDAAHVVHGDTGNVLIKVPATNSALPTLLFSAHMDTVRPTTCAELHPDGCFRSNGGEVLGADDRSGICAITAAVDVIRQRNIQHGDLLLLFTIAEEIGLKGASACGFDLSAALCGFVIDTGGPIGRTVLQAPTHDVLEFVFTGKCAHAGIEPEAGIDANRAASLAVAGMKLGRLDAETTANVGVIRGGSAVNIVSDRAELLTEARSHDPMKLAALIEHMRQAAEAACQQTGAKVQIKHTREYEAYHLTEESIPVRLARHACERMQIPFRPIQTGGGSDANIFNARGIPSVVLAGAMQAIHTQDETASLYDLMLSCEQLIRIVEASMELTP